MIELRYSFDDNVGNKSTLIVEIPSAVTKLEAINIASKTIWDYDHDFINKIITTKIPSP